MGQYVEQGYQFDLTAPQINDILLMARNFSRPNLLHNSRLLVNQRNRTFPYKDTSKSSDFVLDRWRKNSNQLKIVATNIGGAVGEFGACKNLVDENTNPQGNCVIAQRIWAPRDNKTTSNILFDKDITMSILTYEYGLKSVTGHMIASIPSDATENASLWSIGIEDDNGVTLAKLNFINNGKSSGIPVCADMIMTIYAQPSGITLIAAKVEIGIGQTLATKVGNKWVLIDPYDYYEDLKICQRFYIHMMPVICNCMQYDSATVGGTTNHKFKVIVPKDVYCDFYFMPTFIPKTFGNNIVARISGKPYGTDNDTSVVLIDKMGAVNYSPETTFVNKSRHYIEINTVTHDSSGTNPFYKDGNDGFVTIGYSDTTGKNHNFGMMNTSNYLNVSMSAEI